VNIDLGSPVLDVVLGLSFVFFLLSLIVTAVTETISWVMSRRAKHLEEGLRSMLGEDAKQSLLDHPLVQAGVKGNGKPSYLSPRTFSLALLNLFAPVEEGSTAFDSAKEQVDKMAETSPLKKPLTALIQGADNDIKKLRSDVESWFDDTMDRVSGWYKRWTQLVACCVAVVVAVGLNVSALRVADRLASDETVREAVAAKAVQTGSGPAPATPQTPEEAGKTAADATNQLHALDLPIGWSKANSNFNLAMVVGWLLTALAISFGAPFWFDTLSKLSRLRTTGAKPPRDE
jgi:hypothetical protein